MFDIRFVNRYIPAPEMGRNISKAVKVLQSRFQTNPDRAHWVDVIWSEWEDVRTEEEDND